MTTTKTPGSLTTLQISAGAMTLAAIAQAILGFIMSSGNFSVSTIHASFGGIALIAAIVAAVASMLWKKVSGNTRLMGHAIGMAVFGLVQFSLGEIAGGLVTVHIILGILFLAGAAALAVLAVRKPGAASA